MILLDACPATHVCTSSITLPGSPGLDLVLFIVVCCVAPYLFSRRRRR